MEEPKEVLVDAPVTGRVLVKRPAQQVKAVIVGFHGYAENAESQLSRLEMLQLGAEWALVAVQALHVFYNKSGDVVASWMTRQHREHAIRHNIDYVNRTFDQFGDWLPAECGILFAGFSQGTSMAYRAAAACRRRCLGVLAVGGDIPPELDSRSIGGIPWALHARGERDASYSQEQLERDLKRLSDLRCSSHFLLYEGAHEWNEALCRGVRARIKELLA